MRLIPLALVLSLATGAAAQSADHATPGFVRVRIVTSDGTIVVALDQRHAPKTVANFLDYVDEQRLDGGSFYRASSPGEPTRGFVQGGIGTDFRRALPPVALEPTSKTGLHHVTGALSMARQADPNSATGNFSILLAPIPSMDANGKYPGYAVFGRVVAGMDVVRKIHGEKAGAGSGVMKGQMLMKPVTIVSARRLDGTAKPAPAFKPWTLRFR